MERHLNLAMALAGLINLFMPISVVSIDSDCDYEQNLLMGQEYYIHNKEYPDGYPRGISCRWTARSQVGTKIILTCDDVDLPSTPNCQGDRLSISLSGSPTFADAKNYCGKGTLSLVTASNRLTVGLISSINGPGGGRFVCTLTPVWDDSGSSTTPGPNVCDCGWKQGVRIVGGQETGINEFPSMAGILDISTKDVYCGGTIISNKYVITAAHCLFNKNPDILGVLVGDHNVSSGLDTAASALYRVDAYEIHPRFVSSQQGNDIGIMRTEKIIQFNLYVGPACLPFRFSTFDFNGQEVTMLGWGTLEYSGPKADVLQKVNVNVIPNNECSYQHSERILPEQMCTYRPGKDACQSDSGGPLLWMDTTKARLHLVGVISYGNGCASRTPSVNTRVTSYLSWIVSRTSDANYCIK